MCLRAGPVTESSNNQRHQGETTAWKVEMSCLFRHVIPCHVSYFCPVVISTPSYLNHHIASHLISFSPDQGNTAHGKHGLEQVHPFDRSSTIYNLHRMYVLLFAHSLSATRPAACHPFQNVFRRNTPCVSPLPSRVFCPTFTPLMISSRSSPLRRQGQCLIGWRK
jgi:hypothetical protein